MAGPSSSPSSCTGFLCHCVGCTSSPPRPINQRSNSLTPHTDTPRTSASSAGAETTVTATTNQQVPRDTDRDDDQAGPGDIIEQALTHVHGVRDALDLLSNADFMTSSLADVVTLEAQAELDMHLQPLLKHVTAYLEQPFVPLTPHVIVEKRRSNYILPARRKLERVHARLSAFAKEHADWEFLESKQGNNDFEKVVAAMEGALLGLQRSLRCCCEESQDRGGARHRSIQSRVER